MWVRSPLGAQILTSEQSTGRNYYVCSGKMVYDEVMNEDVDVSSESVPLSYPLGKFEVPNPDIVLDHTIERFTYLFKRLFQGQADYANLLTTFVKRAVSNLQQDKDDEDFTEVYLSAKQKIDREKKRLEQIAEILTPLGLNTTEMVLAWKYEYSVFSDIDDKGEKSIIWGNLLLILAINFYVALSSKMLNEQLLNWAILFTLLSQPLAAVCAMFSFDKLPQRRIEKNLRTIDRLAKIDRTLPKHFRSKYGIRVFTRYPITYYLSTLRLEQECAKPEEKNVKPRKTILIVSGLTDHNLAHDTNNRSIITDTESSRLLSFWKKGFNVVHIEAESVEEFQDLIRNIEPKIVNLISHVYIQAHGTADYLIFSDHNPDPTMNKMHVGNLRAEKALVNISSALPPNTEIILGSCSSAGPTDNNGPNLAQWIAKVTGRKTTGVTSPAANWLRVEGGKVLLKTSSAKIQSYIPADATY